MIFVRVEFRTFGQDGTLAHHRQITVQRRNDWTPPPTWRETLRQHLDSTAWRDFTFDSKASADRGVFVYRQILPSTPPGATA